MYQDDDINFFKIVMFNHKMYARNIIMFSFMDNIIIYLNKIM